MELSFIDPVSYGFSLHAKYSQIDFGMYAAFVGMGPSTLFYSISTRLHCSHTSGEWHKAGQGVGRVDLEARLVLRRLSGCWPAIMFSPISLFHVKIFYLGFREQEMTEKLCSSSCFVLFFFPVMAVVCKSC